MRSDNVTPQIKLLEKLLCESRHFAIGIAGFFASAEPCGMRFSIDAMPSWITPSGVFQIPDGKIDIIYDTLAYSPDHFRSLLAFGELAGINDADIRAVIYPNQDSKNGLETGLVLKELVENGCRVFCVGRPPAFLKGGTIDYIPMDMFGECDKALPHMVFPSRTDYLLHEVKLEDFDGISEDLLLTQIAAPFYGLLADGTLSKMNASQIRAALPVIVEAFTCGCEKELPQQRTSFKEGSFKKKAHLASLLGGIGFDSLFETGCAFHDRLGLYTRLDDVARIWYFTLPSCVRFDLVTDRVFIDDVQSIARAFGIDSMIEACYAGVPLADIVA